MKTPSNKTVFLFRLSGGLLFLRWSYLLISMDAYLFSDPTSYLFWSTGIKRILMAAFLGSGLIISSSKFGQKYWLISLILVLISMAGSFFIASEKGDWIFWLASVFIHCVAIFNLGPTVGGLSEKDEGVADNV